jgi:glucose-6-phosphate isomerase
MFTPTGRVVTVIDLDAATPADLARVVAEVPATDLVLMVAAAGTDAAGAAIVGRACSDHQVMTTTVVVRDPAVSEDALSRTLAAVRPWSLMVVVASDSGYVDEILRSFR